MARRALFLDRDGVINEERHFVHTVEQFVWQDGIFELVATARTMGFVPVVVTNQSGIARGLFSQDIYQALTDWMCARFEAEGAAIERVYHCPYLPDAIHAEYRADHPWRKPLPGMLVAAASELDLDLASSLMIGDRWSDQQAAAAAGLPTTVIVGRHWQEPAPAALEQSINLVRCESVRAVQDWLRSQTVTDEDSHRGAAHSKKMNSWSPP